MSHFANERAKFEGWFKVELINILNKNGYKALPEIERIDVVDAEHKMAIELKVINTNYFKNGEFPTLVSKTKPITKNVNSVVKDIEKLSNKVYLYKYVMFIVFPVKRSIKLWNNQLESIDEKLIELRFIDFQFKNGIPGVIYIGKI